MKRTLCILLVLVACLVLTSCKDDRYDDLEKRVTALEKGTDKPNTPTVNIKEPLNGIENQLPDGLIDNKNETPTPEPTLTSTPTPTPILYNYSLDGLSADEIVIEVDSLLDNVPKAGQTYEEYKNSFKVEPLQYNGGRYIEVRFYNISPQNVNKDLIASFWNENVIQTAMDGTIEYQKWDDYYLFPGRSMVTLYITDYTKAVEVYEKLWENEKPLYIEQGADNRNGTTWTISAKLEMFKNQYNNYDTFSVVMLGKKGESLYQIDVYRPIPNQTSN